MADGNIPAMDEDRILDPIEPAEGLEHVAAGSSGSAATAGSSAPAAVSPGLGTDSSCIAIARELSTLLAGVGFDQLGNGNKSATETPLLVGLQNEPPKELFTNGTSMHKGSDEQSVKGITKNADEGVMEAEEDPEQSDELREFLASPIAAANLSQSIVERLQEMPNVAAKLLRIGEDFYQRLEVLEAKVWRIAEADRARIISTVVPVQPTTTEDLVRVNADANIIKPQYEGFVEVAAVITKFRETLAEVKSYRTITAANLQASAAADPAQHMAPADVAKIYEKADQLTIGIAVKRLLPLFPDVFNVIDKFIVDLGLDDLPDPISSADLADPIAAPDLAQLTEVLTNPADVPAVVPPQMPAELANDPSKPPL